MYAIQIEWFALYRTAFHLYSTCEIRKKSNGKRVKEMGKQRNVWTQMLHNIIEFYFNFTLANIANTMAWAQNAREKREKKIVSSRGSLTFSSFFGLLSRHC